MTDKKTSAAPPSAGPKGERIAKRLAAQGLCSRREAERWIADGRIAVNGTVLTTPAFTVGPSDTIAVNGKLIVDKVAKPKLWRYHKPTGLITTHSDPRGRPTVFANLPKDLPRVISVGRLDFDSEGLLLLTNSGDLARKLEHPDQAWLRRYRARVHGYPQQATLDKLAAGITVEGVRYGPIEAQIERAQKGANAWITLSLREGKNREVRRVLEHLGLGVMRLIRVAYGPFQLGTLEAGKVEGVAEKVLREQVGS